MKLMIYKIILFIEWYGCNRYFTSGQQLVFDAARMCKIV